MDRTQERLPIDSSWDYAHVEVQDLRTRITKWRVAAVLLLLALIGVVGYGYLTLQKHNLPVGQLPAVEESLSTLRQRLETAENQMRSWAADREGLEAQLVKLDERINSYRQFARKHTQELTAQLQQRIKAELDQRTQPMEARLTRLESAQAVERSRLDRLQEEVVAVRRDTGRDVAVLHQEVAHNEGKMEALTRQLEPQRFDFELAKNRERKLADGVFLVVTGTNVSHQRYDGRLWLLPNRRTLWARQHSVNEPIRFYLKGNPDPYELVMTDVTRDGVIGYLLLPGGEGAEAAVAELSRR